MDLLSEGAAILEMMEGTQGALPVAPGADARLAVPTSTNRTTCGLEEGVMQELRCPARLPGARFAQQKP